MASVVEDLRSREGESDSIFGPQNLTRLMRVTTDSAAADPVATLQTLKRNNGQITLGDGHPNGKGPIVIDMIRGRLLDRTVHEVIVIYGPPIFFPSEQAYWEIGIRGGLESQTVYWDLDDQPIGNPVFTDAADDPPNGRPTYVADRISEDGKLETVTIVGSNAADKNAPMFLQGETFHNGVGDVQLTKSLARMPTGSMTALLQSIGCVNVEHTYVRIPDVKSIRLGDAGHLLIADAEAHPTQGVLIGQVQPYRIWEVRVVLRFSRTPYLPLRRTVMYNNGGLESIVRHADNSPLTREYRLTDTVNITQLLLNVGSGM